MHLSTVSEWLSWIASLHLSEIELGLDRVKAVAERLALLTPVCPVVIVGGTNGKGSTVAGLESIYRAAGYKTGAFTSPIFSKHNEQVRINGQLADDQAFIHAFEKIAAALGQVSLTPFEFHTLAALLILKEQDLDVWILEVGLGGRLDAVNILDADVAVVTSIGIDHVEWLGETREKIAREKAGIFRHNKPAVCGDFSPPASLIECAKQVGAPLYRQGQDFQFVEGAKDWSWSYQTERYANLPFNALAVQNMAVVLMVVTLLQPQLPVTPSAIEKGLAQVTLTGRIQIIPGAVTEIHDVSHNPDAVTFLAKRLKDMPCKGKTYAVFSMLADKDIQESIKAISDYVYEWYVAPLATKRATSAEKLKQAFQQTGIKRINFFQSIAEAYRVAAQAAQAGDRILVLGSFHTVAEVQAAKLEKEGD